MADAKKGNEDEITKQADGPMDSRNNHQDSLVHAVEPEICDDKPEICVEITGDENGYWEQMRREHDAYLKEEREQEALAENRRAWLSAMPHYPLISAQKMFTVPRRKPDPYLDGLIYNGALTILAGDPKVGKSTFLLHALESMSRGAKFIDRSTTPCSVVYASEQPDVSLFNQTARIPGFKNNEHVHFIPFEFNNVDTKIFADGKEKTVKALPPTWMQQIELWRKCLTAVKANVFVVDTFTAFAQLGAGEAFDSGVVTTRLQQLKTLMSDNPGLAIVILHHLRKEDFRPEKGQNPRDRTFADIANSYALRAATDTNVLIYNPGDIQSTVRELKVESRFLDKPETFQVRLEGNTFKAIPEIEGFSRPQKNDEAQEQIASAIAADPELNKLSNLALAQRLGIAENQTKNYRKTHPKS